MEQSARHRAFWLRLTPVAGAAMILAGPAMAQEPVFDGAAVAACVAQAGDGPGARACIGQAAAACMAQPGGSTTLAMERCLQQELLWWDSRLNDSYALLMALHRAADAPQPGVPPAATPLAPALRDMQRAWIAFRDAACGYEMAVWDGGSVQGPALIGCAMERTAEQALALDDWLAQAEGR